MPANKYLYPVNVGFLRIQAVMKVTNALPELIKQPGRLERRPAVFRIFVIPVQTYSTLMQMTAGR